MSRLTANLSMTNELAEEYRELKRNLIPILLQTCGKERLCDAVDVINLQTRRTKRYKVQYT